MIWTALKREWLDPAETPSLATVKKWLAKWRAGREKNGELDAPFEWRRLQVYGVPWEASDFLLRMWAYVREGRQLFAIVGGFYIPLPTAREALWWWRIHSAAPELNMSNVWWLAQRFVFRELAHHALAEPLELSDLEAHLAYKPWASQEKHRTYLRAIADKRIPPIQTRTLGKYSETMRLLTNRESDVDVPPDAEHNHRVFVTIAAVYILDQKTPELLPCQREDEEDGTVDVTDDNNFLTSEETNG